jgi:serine/threonine-protein kinase
VYRARDTTLHRDVAIKVLLPALANDPDRLARFGREAQLLASLNHPNIAHIHGLADANGVRAFVMELVEGPTLADQIVRGSIPMNEALPIAKQIADALEAAHDHGIIRRLRIAGRDRPRRGFQKVLSGLFAGRITPEVCHAVYAEHSDRRPGTSRRRPPRSLVGLPCCGPAARPGGARQG